MELDQLDATLAQTSTSKQDAALFAAMLSLTRTTDVIRRSSQDHSSADETLEAPSARSRPSRPNPVLMIFEIAHSTDPTSLEMFGRVVDRVRSCPVLLLVTFRPEFEAPWIGRPYVTALILNRL